MSQALRSRAEVQKLARLLQRDPAELEYLQDVPPEDVAQLREKVTDVLFGAHGQLLGRLAAASKLLPIGVVATIGERAFGPVLAARVAGLLEPPRAVEMAAKLPVGFLADVAVELDPRRASEVIARIPPPQIAAITRELIARGEHVTMGRFVGHLEPEAISSAVAVMDDSALLQVAFVLESREGLEELVELLPRERVEGMLDAAARDDLWPEVLDLVGNLSEAQARVMADVAASRDVSVLSSLIASAQEHEMWDAALPITRLMSEPSRRRFAELDAIGAEGVLEAIVAVARERQLWPHVLPLVPCLPDPTLTRLGAIISGLELSDEEIGRLASAADDQELREPVLQLAAVAGLSERFPALTHAPLSGP